jgi:hypothetical protein
MIGGVSILTLFQDRENGKMHAFLGRIAQTQSIATGFILGGFTTVLVLPVIVLLRRLDEPADVVVGAAGKRGPCAAQGIPNVSALDAITHLVTIAEG